MKIQCTLTFLTSNKIQAIKLVRDATGWGLKESKDFCDLAFTNSWDRKYPKLIVMSAEQFGKFEIYNSIAKREASISGICFSGIKVLDEPVDVFDFTKV